MDGRSRPGALFKSGNSQVINAVTGIWTDRGGMVEGEIIWA